MSLMSLMSRTKYMKQQGYKKRRHKECHPESATYGVCVCATQRVTPMVCVCVCHPESATNGACHPESATYGVRHPW